MFAKHQQSALRSKQWLRVTGLLQQITGWFLRRHTKLQAWNWLSVHSAQVWSFTKSYLKLNLCWCHYSFRFHSCIKVAKDDDRLRYFVNTQLSLSSGDNQSRHNAVWHYSKQLTKSLLNTIHKHTHKVGETAVTGSDNESTHTHFHSTDTEASTGRTM